MKIFAGSSNPELAKEIAKEVGLKLGKLQLSKFANGEKRVEVMEKAIGKKAVLLQSLSAPTDEMLVETVLLADALKRMGVEELVGVVPWLGYAKQDKVFQPGEPLSVKVVARLLETAGFSKLVTMDLHNQAIVGFFELPVTELSARTLFLEHFSYKLSRGQTVVVAPDSGAVKSTAAFAGELGVQAVYLDKARDLGSGKVTIRGASSQVLGKEVIVLDDNLVTGETLIKTAKYLKGAGAGKIRVGVTHHLYVPGVQAKIESCEEIAELVVTDTVRQTEKSKKLKVLRTAKLFAKNL